MVRCYTGDVALISKNVFALSVKSPSAFDNRIIGSIPSKPIIFKFAVNRVIAVCSYSNQITILVAL
jgi:type IV secretory pathway protease TraF